MITITGASGKTGRKTAEELIKRGEKVRCIGRSEENLKPLQEKGAEILIGDQSDAVFLTKAFRDADAAYVLIPPKMNAENVRAYYNSMTDVLIRAILDSGLKKLVFLSSLGAEQETGTGPVLGLHDAEKKLDELANVDIVFLRVGYFYENTLMSIGLIKSQHLISNAADPDAPIYMVATKDIGQKAAVLLNKRNFTGHSVVELFGERLSYRQVAKTIGKNIRLPELAYVQANDDDVQRNLTMMGLSNNVAASFVELAHGISQGKVAATKLKPGSPNAPTKFLSFVKKEFHPAYSKAA